MQGTEAKVAVGLKRTHAELVGQGERLAVVISGLLAFWRFASRRNLAEEVQGMRLVTAFLVRTGERQRPLGKGLRLLHVPSQQS